MDELSRALILEKCLERLNAGGTLTECLDRYGEQAVELAPMLAAVVQVRGAAEHHLSDEQRQQAKTRLRAAMMVHHSARKPASAARASWQCWLSSLRPARGLALAGVLAAMLFATMTFTAVAASQPGDAAYPLRVAVERFPVLVQTTPAGKANEELRVTDRRLSDLQSYVNATGEIAPAAVNAILAGDEAAAARAAALPEAARVDLAERLTAQARVLSSLAETAHTPAAGPALVDAAARVSAMAARIEPEAPMPSAPPARSLTPTATASLLLPTVMPTATPVLSATRVPSATPAPTATPGPMQAPRQPNRPTDAPLPPTATHGPVATSAASATPRPDQPGRRATAIAETATARPPATMAPPTASAVPATPVPGRRATALAETATPEPPTRPPEATHTPGSSGGDPATPAPGRRATALAQTATVPTPPPATVPPAESGPDQETPGRDVRPK